jgi:hypothetical protein
MPMNLIQSGKKKRSLSISSIPRFAFWIKDVLGEPLTQKCPQPGWGHFVVSLAY